MELILGALFWLTLGFIPCVLAARRIFARRRFPTLNKLILIVGLGQLALPPVVMVLLEFGIFPYATRGEAQLKLVVSSWAVCFLTAWVLYIWLGILCGVMRVAGVPPTAIDAAPREGVGISVVFGLALLFVGWIGMAGKLGLKPGLRIGIFVLGAIAIVTGFRLIVARIRRYRRS